MKITFNKSSFYEEIDSSCLLLDSHILENVPSGSYPHEKEVEESRLCKLHSTQKGPFNDSKGVTDSVILTKNIINKLPNLYRIHLSTLV